MHDNPGRRPRALAFYLPQFHPIPENDAWWGKGFTEWTNVTRARPLFEGHYQPRLPADLGFYDLRLPEVLQAQADLARQYGVYGFCYHYYWFKGGKRLLERPLEQMLASGKPDFPFCLCWANENWTRRWDGQEKEVLMPQEHDADSDIAFLHSVLPYFRDPRYVRVDGRPLLVIYRATLFPDLAATVRRWREEMQRMGEPPPYLVAAESFDVTATFAAAAGFDATCEFPPHGAGKAILRKNLWPAVSGAFTGLMLNYEQVVEQSLSRPSASLPCFKTVTLNWDNTARKRFAANLMAGFSLEAYHRWLSGALDYSRRTAPESEQFVFVNAWNEWAEGTYLEPDQLYGHAYLEATRAAILGQDFDGHSHSRSGDEKPATTVAVAVSSMGEPGVSSSMPNAALGNAGGMRLIGVAVVGSEADIIEAFVRENLRFVDEIHIASHRSTDGTEEILARLAAEGLPIHVESIETPTREKVEIMRRLIRRAVDERGADWIVPLGADDFIDAHGRQFFEAALAEAGATHLWLPRLNGVPTALDDPLEQNPLRRIRHRYSYPTPSPQENVLVWKIILNATLVGRYLDRYDLAGGAHRLVFRGSNDVSCQPVSIADGLSLRHFPVRSYDQLIVKIGLTRLGRRPTNGEDAIGAVGSDAIWTDIIGGRRDIGVLQSATRHYLDPARATAEQLADTPIILDPIPAQCELRYSDLSTPTALAILRWAASTPDRTVRQGETRTGRGSAGKP